MPRWISQYRKDVYSQVNYLQGLRLPESACTSGGLFVGSGDSYSCALLMEYLSKHTMLAYYPSDLLHCPQMLSDHEIFFISASGRTRSNIKAATIARKFGLKTTAITARSKSALEEVCSKTINLDYLHRPQSSNTGILEFTATVVICMALIGIKINLNNLDRIMNDAREQVNLCRVELARRPTSMLFLGDGISYPLSSYGAFKMHELFGFRSFGYLVDDYYHSPIFSLKKSDYVFVLDHDNVTNSVSADFHSKLKKIHDRSYYFQPEVGQSLFEQILFSIFVVQILSLTIAESLEIVEPYYLSNKMILNLSSSLIY